MIAAINSTSVSAKEIYLFLEKNLKLFKKLNLIGKYELKFDEISQKATLKMFTLNDNEFIQNFISTNLKKEEHE